MKHPSMRYSRLAAGLMLGAAAGLWSLSAPAARHRLVANAAGERVQPDRAAQRAVRAGRLGLHDLRCPARHTSTTSNSRIATSGHRRYWHKLNTCKPRQPLTTGTNANLLATHCDRIDPPLGAAEFNGLYYNPSYTYRPPIKADGTSFPKQTPTSAACDPFASANSCEDWYMYYHRLLRQRQHHGQRRQRRPDLQQLQHQAVVRHRHHLRHPDPVAGDRLLQQLGRGRQQPGPMPPQRLASPSQRGHFARRAPHGQPVPLQQRALGPWQYGTCRDACRAVQRRLPGSPARQRVLTARTAAPTSRSACRTH